MISVYRVRTFPFHWSKFVMWSPKLGLALASVVCDESRVRFAFCVNTARVDHLFGTVPALALSSSMSNVCIVQFRLELRRDPLTLTSCTQAVLVLCHLTATTNSIRVMRRRSAGPDRPRRGVPASPAPAPASHRMQPSSPAPRRVAHPPRARSRQSLSTVRWQRNIIRTTTRKVRTHYLPCQFLCFWKTLPMFMT